MNELAPSSRLSYSCCSSSLFRPLCVRYAVTVLPLILLLACGRKEETSYELGEIVHYLMLDEQETPSWSMRSGEDSPIRW